MSGTRRTGERRKERASARCWPTSSCTTSSISGSISGAVGMRAVGSSIVRYADDFVMGFENADDARRMLVDLKERLAKFGLALHEDKTRLIEFGRLPAMARQTAWRAASGDLRLPRLHPLLRVDPGRPVHREAQNAEQAPDAQAEGAAPGGVAADACAAGRAASLVLQRSARSLRLLSACRTTGAALNGFRQEVRRIWLDLPPTAKPEERGAWAGTGSRLC